MHLPLPPPPPRSPRPLWLDCDPGHDDALALVLALHSPSYCRLLGVSTVASNHSLEAVTDNAAAVLAACGATTIRSDGDGDGGPSAAAAASAASPAFVPLHAGADAPLFLPAKTCPEIHGSSGLCVEGGSFADVVRARLGAAKGSMLLPPRRQPASSSSSSPRGCGGGGVFAAVQAMAEAIDKAAAEIDGEEEEGEAERQHGEAEETRQGTRRKKAQKMPPNVALVATGALTNVALLLWTRPDLVLERKFDLYLMGGALGQGNTGVVSEFNFEVDPHAAAAVFGRAGAGRGLSITMVPLEVTHTALVSPGVLGELGLEQQPLPQPEISPPPPLLLPLSPLRAALRSLLLYFADSYSKHFGFDVGPPLHDPLAVLAAIVLPPPEEEEGEEGGGEKTRERKQRSAAFELARARVDVEVSSHLSLGQSVVDLLPRQLGRSKELGEPNAWVATSVDLGVLWGMLARAIERADAASPL